MGAGDSIFKPSLVREKEVIRGTEYHSKVPGPRDTQKSGWMLYSEMEAESLSRGAKASANVISASPASVWQEAS